jgi:putative transposase
LVSNVSKVHEGYLCLSCGHADHADNNAARVIKKRAIKLVLDSGTELTDKGLLKPSAVIGREFGTKTQASKKPPQAKKRQQKMTGLAA